MRNTYSWTVLCVRKGVVASRSGVLVSTRNSKAFTAVGTNGVSNVRHVHWDLLDIVLSRTWHVKVLRPLVGLHSEAELGNLAHFLVRLRWIAEIKVSQNVISMGNLRVLGCSEIKSLALSESGLLEVILINWFVRERIVLLRSYRHLLILFGRSWFLLRSLDHEAWHCLSVNFFVSSWSGNSKVIFRLGVASQHDLACVGLFYLPLICSRPWCLLGHLRCSRVLASCLWN